MTRPRGVVGLVMPTRVTGPVDRYMLLVRPDGEARMVHTEGVAYVVSSDKPWVWTDYDPTVPKWSVRDLQGAATSAADLADWVRTFGARLESNFHQIYSWYHAAE